MLRLRGKGTPSLTLLGISVKKPSAFTSLTKGVINTSEEGDPALKILTTLVRAKNPLIHQGRESNQTSPT